MTDLGDLLGLPSPPPATGRRRVRCRNPRCGRWVYVDRLVLGYGKGCAADLGLVVVRRRRAADARPDPDLLAELAAILAADPALLPLDELPPALCPSCPCCPAELCRTAAETGDPCVLAAAPRPDRSAVDVLLLCPCAPVACTCAPPTHFRGIARCQHARQTTEQEPTCP